MLSKREKVYPREDLSASFQAAVMIFSWQNQEGLEKYPVKTLVVAGGVAANKGLRERLAAEITDVKVIPPLRPVRQCRNDCLCHVSEWNKGNFC